MPTDFAACLVAQFAHRSVVGSEPVGDDRLDLTMALQGSAHEPQSRRFISGFGDVAFQKLALVIHCAPHVVHLAVDFHINLIEVPPPVAEAPNPADPRSADIGGEHQAEPVPLQTNGFVTDIYPTLEQKILNVPRREREANGHHDYKADDLGRRVKIPEHIGGLAGTGHAPLHSQRRSIASGAILLTLPFGLLQRKARLMS